MISVPQSVKNLDLIDRDIRFVVVVAMGTALGECLVEGCLRTMFMSYVYDINIEFQSNLSMNSLGVSERLYFFSSESESMGGGSGFAEDGRSGRK